MVHHDQFQPGLSLLEIKERNDPDSSPISGPPPISRTHNALANEAFPFIRSDASGKEWLHLSETERMEISTELPDPYANLLRIARIKQRRHQGISTSADDTALLQLISSLG